MATTDVDEEAAERAALAEVDPDRLPDAVVQTERASIRARSRGDDGPTGWIWKLVAGVGAVALLGALGAVAAPATGAYAFDFANETVRTLRSLALLLGAFVGITGLYVAYHRDTGDEADADATDSVELPAANPEQALGPANDVAGARLDEHLSGIDGTVEGTRTEAYRAYQTTESLRGLAVRVVATVADCSTERARERVERGTWTDDVRAAALVGGDEAPERPLRMRVRDWASGRSFERQVEATVDELAALMEVDDP